MAKTPQVAVRLDPELYAKFKLAVRERGETVTSSFEKHMSEVTGEPITRLRTTGLNTREREIYGVTTGRGEVASE